MMNRISLPLSILISLVLVLPLGGLATAQVTERDNQVVARNQRFSDDLHDSQKLQSDYGNALYKGDCLTARQILASADNIYAGLLSSVLDKNGYITQFESEEGKQGANALKKLVENIETQHAKLQQLAGCADKDLPKAAANDKPIADGPTTVSKSDGGCGVFNKTTRIQLLAPHATTMMAMYKRRDEVFASKVYGDYYQKMVPAWLLFLKTYYAVCATADDLKAFPKEIALLIVVRPGTRLPGGPGGTDIVSEEEVRALVEGYNAKEIQDIRDKAAAEQSAGGNNVTQEKTQTPSGQNGSGGLAVPQPTPTPPKIADGPITPPPVPALEPPVIKDGPQTPTPVTPPQTAGKKTTSKKEKPGKKDEGAKPPEPKPAPTPPPYTPPPGTTSPALPPMAGDPPQGFAVPGGVLRRSTTPLILNGTELRPAIAFWVNTTDRKLCQEFRFYQFNRVDFEGAWGADPLHPVNDKMIELIPDKKAGLVTRNGAYVMPGSWGADDYADRDADQASNAKWTTPEGNSISAGPFSDVPFKHMDAPGLRANKGMVDAPKWQGTKPSEDYYKKFGEPTAKPPGKVPPQAAKPAAVPIGKLLVNQQFRTELRCMRPLPRKCLGYVNWSYSETITYIWEWQEAEKKPDLGNETLGMNDKGAGGKRKSPKELADDEQARIKNWVPVRSSTSTVAVPIVVGPWNNDCTK